MADTVDNDPVISFLSHCIYKKSEEREPTARWWWKGILYITKKLCAVCICLYLYIIEDMVFRVPRRIPDYDERIMHFWFLIEIIFPPILLASFQHAISYSLRCFSCRPLTSKECCCCFMFFYSLYRKRVSSCRWCFSFRHHRADAFSAKEVWNKLSLFPSASSPLFCDVYMKIFLFFLRFIVFLRLNPARYAAKMSAFFYFFF